MTLENLRDLFEHELADLYDAEQQLVEDVAENGQGRRVGGIARSH